MMKPNLINLPDNRLIKIKAKKWRILAGKTVIDQESVVDFSVCLNHTIPYKLQTLKEILVDNGLKKKF